MAGAAGAQQRLYARALLSWQDYEAGDFDSSGLRQTYDLGLRRALSEPVRFRLWLRAEGADNDFDLDGEDTSTRLRQLRLGGELLVTYPLTQLRVRWDDIDTDLGGRRSGERGLERGTALVTWRPEGLPDLTLEGELRRFTDDLREEDRTDRRLQATLSETYGPLSLAGTLRTSEIDDARGSLRTTDELQGQAGLDLSFLDGRLASSARFYVLDSRVEERGFGRAAAPVAERLRIAAAWSGIDETPEDSRDRPLDPAAGLIDGVFAPTGIELGPSGQTFRNVDLDLGRFASIDELRLYVRDPRGELVPTGGPVDWRVYVSDDRLDWRRLFFGGTSRFEPAQSLYEVTFPRVSTRYVKAVAFGLNVVDTQLVEVEAFDSEAIAPGEIRRFDQQLASAEASITARPGERVTFSWTSRWNRFERVGGERPDSRTEDLDHYATLLYEPLPWADVQLRYERRSVEQQAGFRQDFEQGAADLIFQPRAGLELRLEALGSRETLDDVEIEADGLAVKSHVRLWRTLDLRLDVGQLRYERRDDRQTERRRYANGWAIAQLTADLQLTASVAETRTELGTGAPGIGNLGDERRWSLEGYWRAGPPLGVGARIGRVTSEEFAATIRGMRLEWSPFHGGALRLATTYDEEVDTLSQRTFRRLTVAPGWTINPHARLGLNHTILEFDGDAPLRTESFRASFELRR